VIGSLKSCHAPLYFHQYKVNPDGIVNTDIHFKRLSEDYTLALWRVFAKRMKTFIEFSNSIQCIRSKRSPELLALDVKFKGGERVSHLFGRL
jgi:hypothetical protein